MSGPVYFDHTLHFRNPARRAKYKRRLRDLAEARGLTMPEAAAEAVDEALGAAKPRKKGGRRVGSK